LHSCKVAIIGGRKLKIQGWYALYKENIHKMFLKPVIVPTVFEYLDPKVQTMGTVTE
jgi:hypothetical protein